MAGMGDLFDGIASKAQSIPTSAITGVASFFDSLTGYIPQLMLGDFLFSLNTAAYQDFKRNNTYRWSAQEVFGAHEVLQYCGSGPETITLAGVIYPEYKGGTGQIDKLRVLAASGVPQMMITVAGGILGEYVIETIEETHTVFAAFGVAKKIEFNLTLRNFSVGDGYDQLIAAVKGMF